MNFKRIAIALVAVIVIVWGAVAGVKALHKTHAAPAPVAVTQPVQAPYTVTKTDPKVAPVVKAKAKHTRPNIVVKAPAPAPKPPCTYVFTSFC
jgi:hypothetical protein